jgi:CubicO group peptidase (beta-lactamase class C family)
MYNPRMTQLPGCSFRRALPVIVLAVLAYTSSAQTPSDHLKQVVQPYVDAQMFMGSVLVAKNGKVIFSKSYGMADLEWSVPNSSTTRFNIASMTKQFTAASILLARILGQDHHLSLTDAHIRHPRRRRRV